MTSRNEPAFPVSTSRDVGGELGHQDGAQTWQFPGMTLRDYFAAKVMQSILTSDKIMALVATTAKNGEGDPWIVVADTAYTQADAMLRSRGAV